MGEREGSVALQAPRVTGINGCVRTMVWSVVAEAAEERCLGSSMVVRVKETTDGAGLGGKKRKVVMAT